jgi:hypothetical protein
VTVRSSFLASACAVAAAALLIPGSTEAQPRRAVPRAAVVVRPNTVVRPLAGRSVFVRPRSTVFVGDYYYPPVYRASLFYGGYGGFSFGFSYGRSYGGAYPYRAYYGYAGWPYYAYAGWPYYGYAGWPYYASAGWPHYGNAGYPYYGYAGYDLSGSVRLQVAPRQTEVFVDGYYAGTVDDFDGVFQRLHVEPGDHEIELYLPGHRPHQQRVYVQPGRTFNIRHVMEPLAPGEPETPRPNGAPLPPAGTRNPLPPAPRDPGAGGPRPLPDPRGAGPAVQVTSFGQLSLRVQPGDADVLIDGERWTGALDNDRLIVQLASGLHRLEIRKDGYRSYFTDITTRAGVTTTLNVALTRQ